MNHQLKIIESIISNLKIIGITISISYQNGLPSPSFKGNTQDAPQGLLSKAKAFREEIIDYLIQPTNRIIEIDNKGKYIKTLLETNDKTNIVNKFEEIHNKQPNTTIALEWLDRHHNWWIRYAIAQAPLARAVL
jgi:helix-turn-helix protein